MSIKEFTVYRGNWLRGTEDGALLTDMPTAPKSESEHAMGPQRVFPAGSRCCLGHLGRDCGVPDEAMLPHGLPHETFNHDPIGWPSALFQTIGDSDDKLIGSKLEDAAVRLNDCRVGEHFAPLHGMAIMLRDDAHREELLTELFAEHGLTVHFVDGTEPSCG